MRVSPAGLACNIGAATVLIVEGGFFYLQSQHCPVCDPREPSPHIELNATSVSTSISHNLVLIPGKAAEPGRIRAEAPLSTLFPAAQLALDKR